MSDDIPTMADPNNAVAEARGELESHAAYIEAKLYVGDDGKTYGASIEEQALAASIRTLLASTPPHAPFKCAARGSMGANDPQDCDWPVCGCDPHADKVIEALEERASTPPADAGRDGWVLVPREPTPIMRRVGSYAVDAGVRFIAEDQTECPAAIYRAMIAAAPTPEITNG